MPVSATPPYLFSFNAPSALSAQCFYCERISTRRALQTIPRPCLGPGTVDEEKLRRECSSQAEQQRNGAVRDGGGSRRKPVLQSPSWIGFNYHTFTFHLWDTVNVELGKRFTYLSLSSRSCELYSLSGDTAGLYYYLLGEHSGFFSITSIAPQQFSMTEVCMRVFAYLKRKEREESDKRGKYK